MTSSHLGSVCGITALKDDSAHLPGYIFLIRLLGIIIFPFLDKYLSIDRADLLSVNLAIRHQRLIVVNGNPKGIRG
ncbi:hypothetical protein DSUL_100098 [Desulfovibrionales bacterium]